MAVVKVARVREAILCGGPYLCAHRAGQRKGCGAMKCPPLGPNGLVWGNLIGAGPRTLPLLCHAIRHRRPFPCSFVWAHSLALHLQERIKKNNNHPTRRFEQECSAKTRRTLTRELRNLVSAASGSGANDDDGAELGGGGGEEERKRSEGAGEQKRACWWWLLLFIRGAPPACMHRFSSSCCIFSHREPFLKLNSPSITLQLTHSLTHPVRASVRKRKTRRWRPNIIGIQIAPTITVYFVLLLRARALPHALNVCVRLPSLPSHTCCRFCQIQ